jgi:Tc toxin complex TcA C-terminal TcB-binding domain/Neuraminidase-like domain/Salmonella virulence plasmid 28.1kDa A protein/Putative peptidoglycan binding domain
MGIDEQPPPPPTETTQPPPPPDLVRGDSGPNVVLLQNFLFQEGYRISEKEQADKFFGDTTYDALVDYQKKHKLVPNGIFDGKARWVLDDNKPHPNKYIVLGQVIDATGNPMGGKTVKAFDKDLRTQVQIGSDTTKVQSGEYAIMYQYDDFDEPEKGTADLFVQVFDTDGTLLATSPIIFNAGKVELVNFTIGNSPGVSEFEKIVNDIFPVIKNVVNHAGLTADDIAFLNGETGIDTELLTLIAESARRNVEANQIAQSVFYGLFRQNLPTALAELMQNEIPLLRAALETSSNQGIIPQLTATQLDQIVEQLRILKASLSLASGAPAGTPSLGDLLGTIPLPSDKQQVVAGLIVKHGGTPKSFWDDIDTSTSLNATDKNNVRFTLHAGDLTTNHLPLVTELRKAYDFVNGGTLPSTVSVLRRFAAKDATDWKTILEANNSAIGAPPSTPGANQAEKIVNYATALNAYMENALPTPCVAGRVDKDAAIDNPFKNVKADLKAFFDHNPNYEFREVPIDVYIGTPAADFTGVNNRVALVAELKNMQRLFNVLPRYAEMRSLRKDDLHSAFSMVKVGERRFIEKYSAALGGESAAQEAYRKAKQMHATAMNFYLGQAVASNSAAPAVVSSGGVKQAIAKFASVTSASPDLTTLFGSLDFCECEQCQSVYSPAAYFVDILKFLNDGPKKAGLTPLQVLIGRRPDLEHIELTCENTTTQVPYVDLTREIMERAVKARVFKITEGSGGDIGNVSATLTALNNETMPQGFPAIFRTKGYPLTDKASVRIDKDLPANAWLILDTSWSFTVKYLGTGQGFDVAAWPQTSWTTDELRANPEHVNKAAYTDLSKAVYSWSLPLNVPVEEIRGYLGHFDVKRTEVMETFFRDPAATASVLSIAREYIGLTTEEAKIINGETTGGPDDGDPTTTNGPWDFWGVKETGNSIDDPTDGSANPKVGTWDEVLQRVSIFLQQSGLSYREMLEVLGSYFINPAISSGRKLGIVSTDANDATTCNLSKLEIRVVDPTVTDDAAKKAILIATWNKIHRFVRLARKLGWTMRDLDKAIVALSPAGSLNITDTLVIELSHIQRLSAQFGLPVVNLLCFRAPMDTGRYLDHFIEGDPAVPSLYATLFNNRAAAGQSLPEDSATLTGTLSGNKSRIAAALQISIDDLTVMLADTNVVTDDLLNLANLSALYRHATFARALNYSTPAYLAALKLINPTPFTTTDDTMKFVQDSERIAAAGFSVEDLNYLLRHDFAPTFPIAISDTAIAAALESIRSEVQKVAADNNFVAVSSGGTPATSDPNGDLTKRKLASLNWDTTIIDQLIAALGNASPETADVDLVKRHMSRYSVPRFDVELHELPREVVFTGELKNKIYYDSANDRLHFIGVMSVAESTALSALSTDATYKQKITELFDLADDNPPTGSDVFITSTEADTMFASGSTPAARFVAVLAKLLPYLRTTLSERIVIQLIGEYLKFDSSAARELLTNWVKSTVTGSTEKAINVLLDPAFAGSNPNVEVTRGAFGEQFNTIVRLFKIAMLNLKFGLTSQRLQWLFDFNPGTNWLDLNKLPFASGSSEELYRGWARVADLFQLSASLPLSESVLTDVFTAARDTDTTDVDPILQRLSQGLSWKLENLTALNDGFAFDVINYRDEQALRRLNAAFKMMNRVGASADQCLDWTKDDADEGKFADDVKGLVRATLSDTQWLEKAKALNDPLREKQRAGLVSYLMLRRDARNADDLYDDFLVDVEMSPCMMTTRIKQAIGSIQLFIQRSLMNLESDVALTTKEARQWAEWRKQYRVWEANRKILLYPENWIEPELRDGKSVFFEELESELLQGEVTMETAETALQHYLEKLHEVARLEIVGMYQQQEFGPKGETELDVRHVIGRTFSAPHVHYYRRQIDSASWTAWEKVEADIQGDHLIPVIWNRRLYLFWPIFTVKQKEKEVKVPAPGSTMEKGEKELEIQLAWTEYKNGKWSAKKLATPFRSTLKHPSDDLTQADFKLFSFKSRVQTLPNLKDEQLFIDFYGPVEKLNTVTITANDPRPKQETLLFSLGAGKTKNVIASVNNKPFTAGDASLVAIIARDSNNQAVGTPITLSNAGTKEIKNTATATLKYFLSSADYKPQGITNTGQKQVCWIVDRNQQPLLVGGNGNSSKVASLAVETTAPVIARDAAITPMLGSMVLPGETQVCEIITEAECTFDLVTIPTTTTSTTYSTTSVNPTEAIASFYFDDGQQSVTPLFDSNAISRIEPVVGTRFENMMMVEFENQSTDGLTETNILRKTPGTFRLLPMSQSYQAKKLEYPAFFQDDARSYFMAYDGVLGKVRFSTFYHPTIPAFFKSLNHDGVSGMLSLANQRLTDTKVVFDDYSADPAQVDINAKPRENVDFAYNGAYSVYNWELFFHTPFMIATQLSKNQRFEEAQKWFHYIFDPTATDSPDQPTTPGPERFWRVKPLYEQALKGTQTLDELFADDALEAQIQEWQANPFKPHVIARLRLVTYMKAVVMRYIDNLIAWGDQLFRRDSIESINEATQLYILAAQILGRRPEQIPARAKAKVQTFRSLNDQDDLNGLANASVEIEGFLSPSVVPPADGNADGMPLMPFFGIPGNDKLLGYWTTVADRLFKIRHCQNIDGIVRTLPAFDSPIDPGLLVRAAAVGVDVASALSDINVALPHYRFNIMMQKAAELCGEVKSLGGALLSALEKRDSEEIALLRSTHEMKVLNAVRAIKEKQLQEATATRTGLDRTKELTTIRRDYYRDILFINDYEGLSLGLTTASLVLQGVQAIAHGLAGTLHLIPEVKVAAPTSAGLTLGGSNIATSVSEYAASLSLISGGLSTGASMASTMGGYQRRFEDWKLQERMANKELEQIEKQIAAADIRVAIAETELRNHDLQVENTREVDEFMRSKFTNRELYDWMVGQISGIYFQSYQLAYDVAKRAECAYRYELAVKESSFIQFGYWDSLKKGLMAGERLSYDIKRMEIAYLDQNRREYEIVKHVSLQSIDPVSLLKLKQTGECFVTLPETLFDVDYPGHYMRRMKSVGVTVPCVAGPYTGINCTLTLLSSSIRHVNTLAANKYARQADDARFADSAGAVQSIVTSNAQNDSGLFETNLRDERYLPFEGQGAISTWRIELPKKFKSFDYNTISDVVIHVRYTSREGGSQLRGQAEQELETLLNEFVRVEGSSGLTQMYSLRHEFGTEWSRFLSTVTGEKRSLTMPLTRERFPFLFQGKKITINEMELIVKPKTADHNASTLVLTLGAGDVASGAPLPLQPWNDLVRGPKTLNNQPGSFTMQAWRHVDNKDVKVEADGIQDILVVCHYTVSEP